MRTLTPTAYLALIVTVAGVSIVSASELQKKEFSIVLPDGWKEIPREELDRAEEATAKALPHVGSEHWEHGFQLEHSQNWFDYPYVLIQVKHTGRISQGELDKHAGEGSSVNQNIDKMFSPMISDIQMGKLVYDKQSGLIWMRGEVTVANVGNTSGLLAIIPTEDGIIRVHCSSLTKDYAIYGPLFRSLARSVTPIPSLAYKQRPFESSQHYDTMDTIPLSNKQIGKIGAAILLGALCAIVGGVVVIIGYVIRKSRNSQKKD